jgi:hypothetical protein
MKTGLDFPMESFLQIKREIISDRLELEKEKDQWATVRASLTKEEADRSDEQFRDEFEKISLDNPDHTFLSLQTLVKKGASARLLGNYELGDYNLAMLIKDIPVINDIDSAYKIIRITIIAGANLQLQKAYAGNGGSVSIEWLSLYLAGIELKNKQQYICCYKILSWITENDRYPFTLFIAHLREAEGMEDWQKKTMLKLMCLGYSPLLPDNVYQSASLFSHIAVINASWLTLLFPYEHDQLKQYLTILKANTTEEIVKHLINAFTSSNKTRKHFRAFFSLRPHWLLKFIVESVPEVLYNLVKRNEKELLIPFLKYFQPAMIKLRNEKGHSLLEHAMQSRGLMENTIQLLRRANF